MATDLIPRLMEARAREGISRKIPQFRSIRETLYDNNVPHISLEFAYEVKATGDIIILNDLESTPTSRFPPSKYTKLYESAKVKVIINTNSLVARRNFSKSNKGEFYLLLL